MSDSDNAAAAAAAADDGGEGGGRRRRGSAPRLVRTLAAVASAAASSSSASASASASPPPPSASSSPPAASSSSSPPAASAAPPVPSSSAASPASAARAGRWRRPLLPDSTPVPLRADDRRDVEVAMGISCRDLLGGSVEDVKCFCVVYLRRVRGAAGCATRRRVGPAGGQGDGGGGGEGEGEGEGEGDGDGDGDGGDLPEGSGELGRTEVVYNSCDPTFSTTFTARIPSRIDERHDVIVVIYSETDVMDDDLTKQRYLGRATFRLERILSDPDLMGTRAVSSGGRVAVVARTLERECEYLVFCLSGRDFKKRSRSVSDVIKSRRKVKRPYVVVSYQKRPDKDGNAAWGILWKSEAVRAGVGSRESSVDFGFGQFRMRRVNGGDMSNAVRMLAMDWDDKNQSYKNIGQADTTLERMLTDHEFAVMHKGKPAGYIVVRHVERIDIPAMAHYAGGGACPLDLMFGIDLTSGNGGPGEPNHERSLHRLNSDGRYNEYETVLRSVGSVFEDYSSAASPADFKVWGFGAIGEGESSVDHCMPVGRRDTCRGAGGLLGAYAETIRSGITMSSPKLLRPVLDAAIARTLHRSQSRLSYGVLVVLCCDGTIHDAAEVMEKISQASYIPLSVVLVGMGDGDFADLGAMKLENSALTSPSGHAYMRDVARFVQYSKYRDNSEEFLRRALEKIPAQLVQYHLSNGIFPPEDKFRQCSQDDDAPSDDSGEAAVKSPSGRPSSGRGKSAMSSGDLTAVVDNRTRTDYGRFILDSVADLDLPEEDESLSPRPAGERRSGGEAEQSLPAYFSTMYSVKK